MLLQYIAKTKVALPSRILWGKIIKYKAKVGAMSFFLKFQNYHGTSDTFWVSVPQRGECISQIEKGQHSCLVLIAKMLN